MPAIHTDKACAASCPTLQGVTLPSMGRCSSSVTGRGAAHASPMAEEKTYAQRLPKELNVPSQICRDRHGGIWTCLLIFLSSFTAFETSWLQRSDVLVQNDGRRDVITSYHCFYTLVVCVLLLFFVVPWL